MQYLSTTKKDLKKKYIIKIAINNCVEKPEKPHRVLAKSRRKSMHTHCGRTDFFVLFVHI